MTKAVVEQNKDFLTQTAILDKHTAEVRAKFQKVFNRPFDLDLVREEIRLHIGLAAQNFMEVGIRLLWANNNMAPKPFADLLSEFNISEMTGARLMLAGQAVLKYPKLLPRTERLSAAKFDAVLSIGDDELRKFADNGSIRNLSLDDFNLLSLHEIQKLLRQHENLKAEVKDLQAQLAAASAPKKRADLTDLDQLLADALMTLNNLLEYKTSEKEAAKKGTAIIASIAAVLDRIREKFSTVPIASEWKSKS